MLSGSIHYLFAIEVDTEGMLQVRITLHISLHLKLSEVGGTGAESSLLLSNRDEMLVGGHCSDIRVTLFVALGFGNSHFGLLFVIQRVFYHFVFASFGRALHRLCHKVLVGQLLTDLAKHIHVLGLLLVDLFQHFQVFVVVLELAFIVAAELISGSKC